MAGRPMVDATELAERVQRHAFYGTPGERNGFAACRRMVLSLIASMVTAVPETPEPWTRDTMLAALDAHPGSYFEWLNPYNGRWDFVGGLLTIADHHPDVIRYDVRLVIPEPERLPWWTIRGRTMPGSLGGTPAKVSEVRVGPGGEPQWLPEGDFSWCNLRSRCDWNDDGTVAVLPVVQG